MADGIDMHLLQEIDDLSFASHAIEGGKSITKAGRNLFKASDEIQKNISLKTFLIFLTTTAAKSHAAVAAELKKHVTDEVAASAYANGIAAAKLIIEQHAISTFARTCIKSTPVALAIKDQTGKAGPDYFKMLADPSGTAARIAKLRDKYGRIITATHEKVVGAILAANEADDFAEKSAKDVIAIATNPTAKSWLTVVESIQIYCLIFSSIKQALDTAEISLQKITFDKKS